MFATTRSRVLAGACAVLLASILLPPRISANHKWGKYHWPRPSNPIDLMVGDNVDSGWDSYLNQAVADWDVSTVLTLSKVPGQSDDNCSPTLGRVEACNDDRGPNGWLGIAQIWITQGSHIAQAITVVNDYYFNQPQYNTPAWKQFVMCQEIGHDWGLGHQDENFNNANLGSCMDYTGDPDGTLADPDQLSNVSPNQHDYDQLLSIYNGHLDGGGGSGGGGGGGRRGGGPPAGLPESAVTNMQANSRAEWGRLIRSNGRVAIFDLDLGNGNHIFTFVIWA